MFIMFFQFNRLFSSSSSKNERYKKLIPNASPRFDSSLFDGLATYKYNCYNYALRLLDHEWARPGLLKKEGLDGFYKAERISNIFIQSCLEEDGLVRINPHSVSKRDHIIAAVVSPAQDYHFYSFDNDGTWSHQDRTCHPIKTDFNVSAPEQDFLDECYTEFCGLYKVPRQGIEYLPS